MRILYFYQYFATPRGSWGTRVYEFGRRWVEAGDNLTVVTSVYDKSDLKSTGLVSRFQVDGIDVIVINLGLSNKHGVVRRLYTFGAYALVASWFALTIPADVAVSSSGPLTVGIPGLVARYIRRLPFVFEARDLWPEVPVQLGIIRSRFLIRLAFGYESLCYRAASFVIVLSEGMKQWLAGTHSHVRVEVVPNASDNELFEFESDNGSLPDWASDRKLALFTGTMGSANDCMQIIRMAERLRDREVDDVLVVMIGDGKERAALESYIHEVELKNVRFLPLMPKNELVLWLKRATCSLLVLRPVPIFDTSSPNKLFDALAAGLPVVQTTQGWIKDLLEKERCGLTVPSRDPDLMADAVLRISRNTQLREQMSINARRVAREKFDRDMLARDMRLLLALAANAGSVSASEEAGR